MNKKFIIAIDKGTKEQRDKFTKYLESLPSGWWHWLSDVWLIDDNSYPEMSSIKWRDKVQKFFPSSNILVMDIKTSTNWSSWNSENAHKWLQDNWI